MTQHKICDCEDAKEEKTGIGIMTETTRRERRNYTCTQMVVRTLLAGLLQVVVWAHQLFDYIVEIVFDWWYCESKIQGFPPVKQTLLLESAVSLADKIRNKKVRAEEVIKLYIERIKEVNPILNAVVDERFEEALKEARAVDDIVASKKPEELEKEKPFLGVPFTTKDSTACKGLLHTLGLVSRKDVRCSEDAAAVARLKEAGAILLGVTNIPEMNMWCESRNLVYGQTCNPYDTRRTVGGSSGGEASIIAACGSPLGLGSDIGGSIRLPAFCCGIFGHKPTPGLVPTKGITYRTGEEGRTMVSAGPMSRYAEDLAPMFRVLMGSATEKKLDFDINVSMKDLQIAYADHLGDLRVSSVNADMLEALQRAVNHFQETSIHPVRKIQLKGMRYAYRLWHYWILQEKNDFAHDLADRKGTVSWWRELFKKLLGLSNHTLAAIVRLIALIISPHDTSKWAETLTEKLIEQIKENVGENGVLLFPSCPTPAMHHYATFLRPYNFMYFAIFNALNLPVTQVPMGLNKQGLPVGIQVVAPPNKDHLCIAVARELEKAFGGYVPPFES